MWYILLLSSGTRGKRGGFLSSDMIVHAYIFSHPFADNELLLILYQLVGGVLPILDVSAANTSATAAPQSIRFANESPIVRSLIGKIIRHGKAKHGIHGTHTSSQGRDEKEKLRKSRERVEQGSSDSREGVRMPGVVTEAQLSRTITVDAATIVTPGLARRSADKISETKVDAGRLGCDAFSSSDEGNPIVGVAQRSTPSPLRLDDLPSPPLTSAATGPIDPLPSLYEATPYGRHTLLPQDVVEEIRRSTRREGEGQAQRGMAKEMESRRTSARENKVGSDFGRSMKSKEVVVGLGGKGTDTGGSPIAFTFTASTSGTKETVGRVPLTSDEDNDGEDYDLEGLSNVMVELGSINSDDVAEPGSISSDEGGGEIFGIQRRSNAQGGLRLDHGHYSDASSTSLSFLHSRPASPPFVRTRVRQAIDTLLSRLPFAEKQHEIQEIIVRGKVVWRFEEALHPGLRRVFKLDPGLLVELCECLGDEGGKMFEKGKGKGEGRTGDSGGNEVEW